MEKSGFDFWASLCSHDVHPVGWAASNDLIILPPRSIEKTQVSYLNSQKLERFLLENKCVSCRESSIEYFL